MKNVMRVITRSNSLMIGMRTVRIAHAADSKSGIVLVNIQTAPGSSSNDTQ